MNLVTSELGLFLLNQALSASVILSVTLLAYRCLRRSAAPVRHGVLAAGLVVLTAVPLIATIANHWDTGWFRVQEPTASIPAPVIEARTSAEPIATTDPVLLENAEPLTSTAVAAAIAEVPSAVSVADEVAVSEPVATELSSAHVPPEPATVMPAPVMAVAPAAGAPIPYGQILVAALTGIWLLGTLLVWARLLYAGIQLRRLAATFEAPVDRRLQRVVRRMAAAIGIHRPIRVVTSEAVPAPLSLGLLRPTVIIPARLQGVLERNELESILTHELAHIARLDHWWGAVQHAVLALYWWHPLARWLGTALEHTREEVCDNFVLRSDVNRRSYAALLVDMAERTCLCPCPPLTAGLLPPWRGLEDRVCGLLDKGRQVTTALSRMASAIILVAAFGVSFLVCGVRVAYGGETTPAKPVAKEAAADSVLAKAAKGDPEALKKLRTLIKEDEASAISLLRIGAGSKDTSVRELATRELLRIGSDAAMAALDTGTKQAEATTNPTTGNKPANNDQSAATKLESTFSQIEYATAKARLAGDKEKAAAFAKELAGLRAARKSGKLPKGEGALHAVSLYEGLVSPEDKKKYRDARKEARKAKQKLKIPQPVGMAKVKVTDTSQPVTLFLCAYDPTRWQVELGKGVQLKQVIVSGYHRQEVTGVGKDVKVTVETYEQNAANCPTYIDPKFRDKAHRIVKAYTGQAATTFQGRYRASDTAMEIGPGNDDWRAQVLLPRAEALLRVVSGKPAPAKMPPELLEWQNKLDNEETAREAVSALAKSESPAARDLLYRWIHDQIKDQDNGGLYFGALPALEQLNDKRAAEFLGKLMREGIPGQRFGTQEIRKHGRKSLLKMSNAGNEHATRMMIANAQAVLADNDASRQDKFREFYTMYELARAGNADARAALAKVKADKDQTVAAEATALLARLDARAKAMK